MISTLKEVRQAYGFEDVSIVPGAVTVNPEQADLGLTIGDLQFSIPIIASAMDAVVSPSFAVQLGKMGGLGVLNMEGLYSRYVDAPEKVAEIAEASPNSATGILQSLYQEPIKESLVAERVEQIHKSGANIKLLA